MHLKDLQRIFQTGLILGELPSDLAPEIAVTATFAADERFSVYSWGYRGRLREIMGLDFLVSRNLLTLDRFEALVDQYFAAHPSSYFTVSQVGEQFPAYLAARTDVPPAVAEVARFEWLLARTFFADELTPITAQQLGLLSETEPERLSLALHPSVTIFESAWPFPEIYADEKILPPATSQTVVYRPAGSQVLYQGIEAPEARLLKAAADGASLAELGILAEQSGLAPEEFGLMFQGWMQKSWLLKLIIAPAS